MLLVANHWDEQTQEVKEIANTDVTTREDFEMELSSLLNTPMDLIIYMYPHNGEASIYYYYDDGVGEINYRNARDMVYVYNYPDELEEALSDITLDFQNELE